MKHPEVLAAVALAVILAVAWLSTVFAERRRRGLQGRLAAVLFGAQPGAESDATMALRRPRPISGGQRLRLVPSWFRHRLAEELGATGDRLGVAELVIVALVGGMLAAGLLVLVMQWSMAIIILPLVLAVSIAAAVARLRSAQHRFQQRFIELFPDALDVVVRAVRAGLPVLDAIEAAVENIGEPIAGEFRRLLNELRIGIDLEIALAHEVDRIRVNDFRFFAATLVLQRRTGGSLAETLVNLAGLIRRRKELRLKAGALSAESRATAYVIGALPFILGGVMYLINPGLISLLFTDPRGRVMVGIAFCMLILGFVMMRVMITRATR
jgi:tight adherence protein B